MEAVSTIDPNNEECNNGLHHTNGGHSATSKGSLDIDSFLKTLQKDSSNFNIDLVNCVLPKCNSSYLSYDLCTYIVEKECRSCHLELRVARSEDKQTPLAAFI